ncbi:hypothetical protein C3942_09960 [Solimonas fluminis]|uniref:Uncharacterized protein n=1 Tax=Solimonas fluminis TaxID=2086571 RepID=A0A2S5THA6_9GAMM|nr:hypothetical protein [Solimonas fluminis]PPE74341.1 hypothetical protein C3942_09960 [Solimonas fluminis]
MTEQIAHAYTYSVILATAACAGLLGWLLYRDSSAFLRARRQRLLRALAKTRLHAVLVRRRIDPADYAAGIGPETLRQQLQRCGRCERTLDCDRSINSAAGDPPIARCPNLAAILIACDRRGLRTAAADARGSRP